MSWNTLYLPPDKNQWQGSTNAPPDSAFFQIIQPLNLLDNKSISHQQQTFALIGFQCDEGVRRNSGRVGAAEGPLAIRTALSRLAVHKQNVTIYDAGNIMCRDGDLESAQAALGEVIHLLVREHMVPIALGGGHEIAWGNYQGIAKTFPQQNLGIINFDAHFDMRALLPNQLGSSGTPFLQIATAHQATKQRFHYNCIGIQHASNARQLIETAKQFDTHIIWANELHQGQAEKCIDFVDRVIDENQIIYASICMDVFAAAYAPGVSAIQPLGLWPWHVIPLLQQLAACGKVISYDIAELAPRYDIDQTTAKLAANLIYEIIHHHSDHPR